MRFWKWLLWIGVGIFILSRLAVLMAFPVFNDEAIYLQYAQLIHQDFNKYQYVSEGTLYADWKPPLQYWLGAAFMGLTSNPLLAGRLAVLLFSVFGLWGFYLFIKEFLGDKEAAAAVFLYALCSSVLFYNVQFIAEAMVFSLAPWAYWSFLKAIGGGKLRPWYAVLAAVFGALMLLSKQSGMVYLGLSVLLPLALFGRARAKDGSPRWEWKTFWMRFGIVAGGILLAYLFSRLGVSPQSAKTEGQFNSNWLMSAKDILKFPMAIWKNNWITIRDYYYHYYSIFILLPILYFFFVAAQRARKFEFKDAAIGLGFLAASGAILILLKGFNEYIYNTAAIVFLLALLVRAGLAAWAVRRSTVGMVVLASLALMLGHWAYQDVLMRVSPAKYIERGTPWMVAGYLNNWSGGFGVPETIAYLKQNAGSGPGAGLVMADPQWGNPRTAIEVWHKEYPRLRLAGITGDFRTEEGAKEAKTYIDTLGFSPRFAVYSSATNSTRILWQTQVQKYFCNSSTTIQVAPLQPPIVICTF